jgi:hypothetical protein
LKTRQIFFLTTFRTPFCMMLSRLTARAGELRSFNLKLVKVKSFEAISVVFKELS